MATLRHKRILKLIRLIKRELDLEPVRINEDACGAEFDYSNVRKGRKKAVKMVELFVEREIKGVKK